MKLENVLIIANPGSGRGDAPEYAQRLREVIEPTYDSKVTIRETTKFGDATEWARDAKDEGYDTVICLGGDGTVNETVNGLMQIENPPQFSFVPMGTANDLGRVLGFKMDSDLAVDQFKHLTVDAVDIGQVNDRYFVDVVAVGDLSSAVMETDSDKKNSLGFFAYVIDGAKAVVEGEGDRYIVQKSSGEEFELNSALILMALTSSIGGVENLISHGDYKNGLVQFVALKDGLITSALDTLVNDGGIQAGHTDNENILSFTDDSLSLRLVDAPEDKEYRSNVDGDEGPVLPLVVKVHHKALTVLRPEK